MLEGNLTVDEVIEGVFVDDSEIETLYSESDSDSSEGVCSENLSAKEIGTDNIHSCISTTQATRRRAYTIRTPFHKNILVLTKRYSYKYATNS